MRTTSLSLLCAAGVMLAGALLVSDAAPTRAASPQAAPLARKAYGEWRIRIKPDRGAEYAKLIQDKGLPLFREAGGRMVGWWTTLIGDLYEHVTIWEYDGLPGFEKAVGILGKDERFKQFAALRDPLLAGEDSRFLELAPLGERPALPENAKMVIHEVHRVPLDRAASYWKAAGEALPVLKKHGFKGAGPFRAAVGRWSEVTYLWLFDSLAEREAKLNAIAATPDADAIGRTFFSLADDVQTRLLLPAPFAH